MQKNIICIVGQYEHAQLDDKLTLSAITIQSFYRKRIQQRNYKTKHKKKYRILSKIN